VRVVLIRQDPCPFFGQADTTVVLYGSYGRLSNVFAPLAAASNSVYICDDIVWQTNVYAHVSLLCASV
jgi:hypothetical protein